MILKAALPYNWNTLIPGLQHTLGGDLVLSNKFEALVGLDSQGVVVPLAAKSWTVSDSFKKITFIIDTSKEFPSGKRLSSSDFKLSWEAALRMQPLSANKSVLDVLYKIEGYEEFEKTNVLSGVVAVDPEKLEISFSSPFRQALEHLVGSRFAAFEEVDGAYFGTGKFEINQKNQNHLMFRSKDTSYDVSLEFIPYLDSVEQLLKGEIDFLPYFASPIIDKRLLNSENIELVAGPEASSLALGLNFKSKVFSTKRSRQLFQKIVFDHLEKDDNFLDKSPSFDKSFQIYRQFQSGRLNEIEFKRTLEGNKFEKSAEDFLRSTPLTVAFVKSQLPIVEMLQAAGLSISDKSKPIDVKEMIKLLYSEDGPDIIVMNYSIATSDPDGIYHLLGKNGAIKSPMVGSRSVAELLEKGREIIEHQKIDSFYREVQKEILNDVPLVHLGFVKAVSAVNTSRVKFIGQAIRRNFGHLHHFIPTK